MVAGESALLLLPLIIFTEETPNHTPKWPFLSPGAFTTGPPTTRSENLRKLANSTRNSEYCHLDQLKLILVREPAGLSNFLLHGSVI